jgi:hypothetical protein
LEVIEMEVVDDDPLRTELRRSRNVQTSPSWTEQLGNGDLGDDKSIPNHQMIRRIQRFAQDMGVLGSGLRGDERWLLQGTSTSGKSNSASGQEIGSQHNTYWDDAFFPQLLEIKWPSEGRLVERGMYQGLMIMYLPLCS